MAGNLTNRVKNQNQNQGQELAAQEAKSQEFIGNIRAMERQYAAAMPRGAEASQLVRDLVTACRQTPRLFECDLGSLLAAGMTCAQLGLRPGVPALGQAYLLPMNVWNAQAGRKMMTATFILGYQGMLDLANRSGDVDAVSARVVYENDTFDVDYGSDTIIHKPAFGEPGAVRGYYAKFRRRGSDYQTVEFMSVAQMKEHAEKFAMQTDYRTGALKGPWKDHFDAMARKTVLRQLFKFMPRDTTIQNAISTDESYRLDANPTADLTEVSKPVSYDELRENQTEDPAQIEQGGSQGEPVNQATGELGQQGQEDPADWGDPALYHDEGQR